MSLVDSLSKHPNMYTHTHTHVALRCVALLLLHPHFCRLYFTTTPTAAFDARTTSARELLRQVRADRFKTANPKLAISATVTGTADPPKVVFQFVDESVVSSSSSTSWKAIYIVDANPHSRLFVFRVTQMDFESENYNCKEILHGVYLKAMQLNVEFEMDGKSIDDVM